MAIVHSTMSTRSLASFNPLDPIGSILDSSLDKVEKTMDKITAEMHDAALDVVMQAAQQTINVIGSLKAAYDDSLQKTYETADKLIRENVDRVDDLVKDIIDANEKALINVADRVEDIVKMSPLSNWWLPLLKSMTPQFFAVGSEPNSNGPTFTPILVTFNGNFAYADRPGCTPSFTVNNTKYTPSVNTTKELSFIVNISSEDPTVKVNAYSFLKGTLEVLWKSGYVPYYSWTNSKYETLLGMLPASPGKITVIYTKPASSLTQVFHSPPVEVSRNKSHWATELVTFSPDPGWNVVRGTGSIFWISKIGGQINASIKSDDYNHVVAEYSRKDGSGSFQVYFTESQPVPEQKRTEEKSNLKWGNSFLAQPQASEKMVVVFDAFNGDHFEFQPRTDNSNHFITIREFDGTLQIQARPASEINKANVSFFKNRSIKAITT